MRCRIGQLSSSTGLLRLRIPMTHLSLGSFLGSMIRRNSMRYRIVQPDCIMAMGLAPLISWCGWLISAKIRGIAAITFAPQLTWQMLLAVLASSCRAIRISTSILVFRTQFGRFIISKSFVRSLGFRCDKVSSESVSKVLPSLNLGLILI